jgi:hypothetical protein
MSTLITTTNLLTETDAIGKIYAAVVAGIDTALVLAQTLATTEQGTIFAADLTQLLEWAPATQGMYGAGASASGSGAGSAFGSIGGFGGGGAFGSGTGALSRYAMMPMTLFAKLENMRKEIAKYGPAVDSSIVDLGTFAAWYNSTPYTVLFSPTLAAAYFFVYGGARQLPAASVFAPEAVVLSTATITGANTVSLVAGALPQANGYGTPASTTDAAGYPLYVGGQPSAQGFAPVKNLEALITTNINGTCALTVTASKAGGGTDTWTGTLDNATIGTKIALTPGTGGHRAIAVPSAVAIAGTATAGAFAVQTGAAERAYL